jgi:TonB-dependent receptor
LNNVTINGVNVPAPEVTVRNIKLDAVPSTVVERIEVYKTLAADQDADGIGGTVNLVTKTAVEKPTISVNTTVGYNPLQDGFWRGGMDATYGQRFGKGKRFGFLLSGTYDKTNRGIDDLEPTQSIGTFNGQNVAYVSSEDLRSYDYYRTRYGFDTGIDYKVTPTMTVYGKGLYADFHDFGDTNVYTPNAGGIVSASGPDITFDNTGSWQYRHYVRRPDQQVFSFLTGARHDLSKDAIVYEFAVSRGHNIGGQDFPTTNFNGPANVTFTQSLANPFRPKFNAMDGTNGFDATGYQVVSTDDTYYHATQLNVQGDASLAHDYTIGGHPSTFSLGVKVRDSASTQNENDHLYNTSAAPFTLASVEGGYKNPTYYNDSFAIDGMAYGPTTSYDKILKTVAANQSAFVLDPVGSVTQSQEAFFNADERVYAGYAEDVIFLHKLRLQGGLRVEATTTHFLTYTVTAQYDSKGNPILPSIVPTRQDSSYTVALPSVQAQYQLQKDTNLRLVYGRGISRPNIGDLVPTTIIDPNASPRSINKGNPDLQPTKANNYDVLIEHFFQPLGVLQGGYFYKQLSDPIYPTTFATTINGVPYQQNQSINGPSAHIQGFEANWEQRFSFLPSFANGFGVAANYSYTESKVKFPSTFNGGRTDNAPLQRQAPNNWNFNLTYDKSRFSGRFAISHNDPSIAAYQWNASSGAASDPILGLKGPAGDNYFYAHTQFDVQGSYRLVRGIEFVASGLNLSNEVFGFYNGSGIYPVQREYYRPTYSFGLRWAAKHEE